MQHGSDECDCTSACQRKFVEIHYEYLQRILICQWCRKTEQIKHIFVFRRFFCRCYACHCFILTEGGGRQIHVKYKIHQLKRKINILNVRACVFYMCTFLLDVEVHANKCRTHILESVVDCTWSTQNKPMSNHFGGDDGGTYTKREKKKQIRGFVSNIKTSTFIPQTERERESRLISSRRNRKTSKHTGKSSKNDISILENQYRIKCGSAQNQIHQIVISVISYRKYPKILSWKRGHFRLRSFAFEINA